MSQRTKSWVVTTLTIFVAMVLSATVSIPAASAATGDPIIPTTPTCTVTLVSGDPATAPPAPTCYDPSGSDIDEFLVPYYFDANGYRVAYENGAWSPYKWDRPNSTNGASQVFVQSTYYDPAVGMYVNGHAWTLTFNTAVTAQPTANGYWVSVGACADAPGSDVRTATAFVRNESGLDGRYIGSVYPESYAKGITVARTQPASRVYDGATVAIPLVIDQYTPGLTTDYTYTVKFWLTDRGEAWDDETDRRLGATLSVYVPKCSGSTSPSNRPSARIVKLKPKPPFSKAKVVLGKRSVTKATKYRVVVNPKVGKTVRKTIVTKHKVLRFKLRGGGVVKVRFNGKVVRKHV